VRKRRKPVTLNAVGDMDKSGQQFGGFWSDLFGTTESNPVPDLSNSDFPPQATSDPNILKQIVPTGTPVPAYVSGVSIGFPNANYDSWYFPTPAAYSAGNAQAAMDTVVATGDQIGATIQSVANVGAGIANNFMPLLIGAIALVLFLKFGDKS